MKKLYDSPEDFEAKITIFTKEEGGRILPPSNGIRWDFIYSLNNPNGQMYMIWPDFFDKNGNSISKDIPLKGTLCARMYIINQKAKQEVHLPRMKVGTEFYCMEGPHKVAKGIITRITGLYL